MYTISCLYRPPDEAAEDGGIYPLPLPGNSLLFHSPRHPKLSWPWHSQSLVGCPVWSNRVWGMLIPNQLTGNNCPEFPQWTSGQLLFQNDFKKRLFWKFLDSRFHNHSDSSNNANKKKQLLSNQSFKHNSTHILSLNVILNFPLNLDFLFSSLTVATQIAEVVIQRCS